MSEQIKKAFRASLSFAKSAYTSEMPGSEMVAALKRLGWSQAELGRRLGVKASSVTRWAQTEAPGYVVEYLRVMELARQILEKPEP